MTVFREAVNVLFVKNPSIESLSNRPHGVDIEKKAHELIEKVLKKNN